MTKGYVINPDRFKNFFNELDTRRTLLTTVTDLNNKLFNHFVSLEEALNKKSLTLDTQIQKFKEDNEKTLESLRIRESVIPEKEVTLAARVQQLKDSGITDIKRGNNWDAKERTMSDLLRMCFRRMDSKGLMEYLLANRKKFVELRVETAIAAEEAVDLLGFVLEAVEEFVELKVSGKKVGGLAPTRCACGILIQAAFPIPSGGEPFCLLPAGGGGVSRRWKERAARVLEKWKGVLSSGGGGEGSDGVSSGEAIMFLTMVLGFGLKEKYDDEFLWSLVLEVGSRRDMAKLAVALGSGDKMRDIIEELVKTGKETEAVYMASEAGLTDLFPPVKLLKSCLRNCQNTDNSTSKDAPSREDVSNELNGTRVIIKCIEDHKLESEFSMSNLKKRIAQLERAKADKKRSGSSSTSKPASNKRRHPRRFGDTASSSSSRPPKSRRVSSTSSAFRQRSHPPPPTHQPSATRYPAPYSYSSPSVYENGPTAAPYGVGYSGPHNQSPAGYLQYANHPSQDIGAGAIQAGGSYAGQVNYGGYDYTAPAAPSEPTYPATYNL